MLILGLTIYIYNLFPTGYNSIWNYVAPSCLCYLNTRWSWKKSASHEKDTKENTTKRVVLIFEIHVFRVQDTGYGPIEQGGKSHWYRKLINTFLFNMFAVMHLSCPSYPLFGSWALYLSLRCHFFIIGLVFFYPQRYMGWFLAAFRPCKWNESRSS